MSLNIKDPKAHELAGRVARLAGETLTEAVTTALRERRQRIGNVGAVEEERFRELKALIKAAGASGSSRTSPLSTATCSTTSSGWRYDRHSSAFIAATASWSSLRARSQPSESRRPIISRPPSSLTPTGTRFCPAASTI
jgi:hypothetical protein